MTEDREQIHIKIDFLTDARNQKIYTMLNDEINKLKTKTILENYCRNYNSEEQKKEEATAKETKKELEGEEWY